MDEAGDGPAEADAQRVQDVRAERSKRELRLPGVQLWTIVLYADGPLQHGGLSLGQKRQAAEAKAPRGPGAVERPTVAASGPPAQPHPAGLGELLQLRHGVPRVPAGGQPSVRSRA